MYAIDLGGPLPSLLGRRRRRVLICIGSGVRLVRFLAVIGAANSIHNAVGLRSCAPRSNTIKSADSDPETRTKKTGKEIGYQVGDASASGSRGRAFTPICICTHKRDGAITAGLGVSPGYRTGLRR
jgi:hypothetical protein